jgi:hypothetical protein
VFGWEPLDFYTRHQLGALTVDKKAKVPKKPKQAKAKNAKAK